MKTLASMDLSMVSRPELSAVIDAVYGGEITALHLRDSVKTPFEVSMANRKYDISFPWLEAVGDLVSFGMTEVAGASYVDDFVGHLDYRPADIMNVHATESGMARADFAPELPDYYLDEDKQVISPLTELAKEGIEIISIDLNAGDVLCFCGGAVAHQFTSKSSSRRSYIRNFHQAM